MLNKKLGVGILLERYKTVYKQAQNEIVVKKSRFIATVLPTKSEEEVLSFIEQIRKANRDAVHNVFAYQLGFNDEIQRQSDDGEPAGTAGKPILEILKKEELKNVVVVVTRYFGGTLLGTGGLIRAYGQSARVGLETAEIVWKVLYQELKLRLDYTWLGKVQNLLMHENCIIEHIEYADIVEISSLTPISNVERVEKKLIELSNNQLKIDKGQERFLTEKGGEILL